MTSCCAYARVYRQRIEAMDGERPGPWFWYYAECDERGEIIGDPSIPMASRRIAERQARHAEYIMLDQNGDRL